MTTKTFALMLFPLGLPLAAVAQDRIEAPSSYQQEVDDLADPTAGSAYEIDAAGAQAEAAAKSGSVPGLSRREATRVEEIVVSARKRDEFLEDTPISVTALSANTLRESGVTRINGIQELVPNMTFQTGLTGQSTQIRIRGVGTSASGPAFDPGVGLYLDGVFLPRAAGSVLDIVDVQQVEVLRGPQGTLFGKNTVGGAVNLTTVKPGMDPGAFVLLRPGSLGTLTTRMMINLPIGNGWLEDRLAVRLNFGSENRRGWVYNAFRDEYVSDLASQTFLGAVRFLPTDDFTIDVSGSYAKAVGHGMGGQCVFMRDASITALIPGNYAEACDETEPFVAGANLAQLSNNENYGTWGILNYDLGALSVLDDVVFKSLTSWRQQRTRARTDLEGSRIDVVDLNAAGGGPGLTDGTPGTAQQIQQEVQMNASTWDGRLNFVTGFFSFWEDAEAGNTVFVPVIPQAAYSNIKTDNFTWALYGQATADVTDWLSLTAGLRYTSDRKSVDQVNQSAINPDAPVGGGTGEKTFTSWTPTVSIALLMPEDWMIATPFDHLMGYFTYSRGFKGGGFNAAVQASVDATTPLPYDPETLDNFEIGLKTIALEQRLTLNIAAFYGKYDDIQVTAQRSFTNDEGNPAVQRLTLNAAEATTQGIEVEMQARPFAGAAITGSLGYLDTEYGSFPDALSDFDGSVIDRTGQSFNLAPRWQTFLAFQYSVPISAGEHSAPWLVGWLTPRVEWAYRSRQHVLGPEAEPARQRGYNLLHARLSYAFLEDRAQVALWARNLLDEAYFQDAFSVGGTIGSLQRWYRPPRMYGGELSYRW